MDVWIGMLVLWAIVEFIQFMRKRPYRARMKTGAIWGTVFAWMALLGRMPNKTMDDHYWSGMLATLVPVVAVALFIYWLRVLLAKGWARMFLKKEVPLS